MTVLLEIALKEIFPDLSLISRDQSQSGFSCTFLFPHAVHPELSFQIEEKIRSILQENREVKEFEMVGSCARAYAKDHGLSKRVKEIEGDGLFTFIQIGSYIDLGEEGYEDDLSLLKNFKVFEPKELEKGKVQFSGAVFSDKGRLKDFLKRVKKYPKTRHEVLGESLGYWVQNPKGLIFLKKGIEERERVQNLIKQNLFLDSFEVESEPKSPIHPELLKAFNVSAILEVAHVKRGKEGGEGEGLFEKEGFTEILVTTFLENTNSLLQSIGKTLNILGFSYDLVCSFKKRAAKESRFILKELERLGWRSEISEGETKGYELTFLVQDGLGRQQKAIELSFHGQYVTVQAGVERNMALLLEHARN